MDSEAICHRPVEETAPEECKNGEAQAQPRSRAGKPKARTGCITCKERRVKCDETKPACLRCLKFWGRCDGYAIPCYRSRRSKKKNPQRTIRDPTSRPLLPLLPDTKNSSTTQVVLQPPAHHDPYPDPSRHLQPLARSIPTESFRSQDHYQSFSHFLQNTSHSLPGLFPTSLWESILPQASHATPFIRTALTAIGALSGCGRKFQEDKFATSGIVISTRYQFALSQFGIAVAQMRENLVAGEKGLNDALIACLLVVCFEALQGNYFQAWAHIVSGHKMFKDWVDSKKSYLTTETAIPYNSAVGEELANTFQRMDLQIMNWVDPRPKSVHLEMKHEGEQMVQDMPDVFTSLQESRTYLELVQRRMSHFVASTAGTDPQLEKDNRMTRIDTGTETGTVQVHPESETGLPRTPSLLPSTQRIEYVAYLHEIERWFNAYVPLFDTQTEGSRDWAAAALLQIEAETHRVMLMSSFSNSLDSFLSTYRLVVDLAEKITDNPLYNQDELFTFDIGVVSPLRLVAKWCREPTIRRKAIALLRKAKCKEGLWDALCMAAVNEWQMEIEEEGMDENGYIPEGSRCRVVDLKVDTWRRSLVCKCVIIGTGEERSTVIEW
ncbi:hypothetical protein VTL71DRAFT_15098 [Oculimacula yallundae]|uniref:Zn(2)-C6 fungal-type domain-containing protein n=1 Tax=Oculimacula yallundae TaxID=86028 RepID=A0ABR4CFL4_9HELO